MLSNWKIATLVLVVGMSGCGNKDKENERDQTVEEKKADEPQVDTSKEIKSVKKTVSKDSPSIVAVKNEEELAGQIKELEDKISGMVALRGKTDVDGLGKQIETLTEEIKKLDVKFAENSALYAKKLKTIEGNIVVLKSDLSEANGFIFAANTCEFARRFFPNTTCLDKVTGKNLTLSEVTKLKTYWGSEASRLKIEIEDMEMYYSAYQELRVNVANNNPAKAKQKEIDSLNKQISDAKILDSQIESLKSELAVLKKAQG